MVNSFGILPTWGLSVGFGINILLNILAAVFFEDTTGGSGYSYVQPDNSTFSVWGIIYSLHLVMIVYNQFFLKSSDQEYVNAIEPARWPLFFQFVTNGLWLIVNGAANAGLSYWVAVVVLAINTFFLFTAYRRAKVDYTCDGWKKNLTLNLPISCNLAWVVLASILNFSNTLYDKDYVEMLSKANPNAPAVSIGSADWAMAVCTLASGIAIYLSLTRLDIGYISVVIWALWGIRRNQTTSENFPGEKDNVLANYALGCIVTNAVAVVVGIAVTLYYRSKERGNIETGAVQLANGNTNLL